MTVDTLGAALSAACERHAERPALTDQDGVMTYGELGDAIAAMAAMYGSLGIERGDRVVCRLPNCALHIVAAGAAWSSGAIHVAADRELTVHETTELIGLTRARVLLHAATAGEAAELARRCPGVRIVSAAEVSARIAAAAAAPTCRARPDDIAAIFTTSGSTGAPKLPLGMHGKLCASWTGLARALEFTAGDVHLVQLPLSHGFGLMLATAGLVAGGRLVLLERFSGQLAPAVIEREGVTVFNGTPAHFRLLVARLGEQRADLTSLRIGVAAGAAFEPPLLESILDELGMELLLMYGASEGVGVATRDREDILAGSVGRPDPPGSVAILDAGGRELPAGEVGEIAFARVFNPVRYWGEPRAQQDGWYRSGDLGRFDDAGRLHVLGRIKHQISRGGLKIDPAEVEAALLSCAGVSDGAVIGVPNPVLDEVVCACVIPAAGARPTLAGLRHELSARLAPFKLPEQLCVLETLPRTSIGKVDHQKLRELARAASAG